MKKWAYAKYCVAFLSALFLLPPQAQGLPPPYDTVDPLPFNPQGWYKNGPTLEYFIRTLSAKVVIEVGCWIGLSTRHIAKSLPPDGIVYAVDHWMGSPNEDNSCHDIANLYRQFLSNVIHEDLTHKIIPLKMSSVEATRTLKIVPDIIYLDATHDYNSVLLDLMIWFPFVKGHGLLCGDDYFWAQDYEQDGPVKVAVDTFARENNLIVRNDGWLWYLVEQ